MHLHCFISLAFLLMIIFSTFLVSSSFPMSIIGSIIMTTILGTYEMMQNSNLIFFSFIIIFLFVGGLMVIYIFILSMNSNEKINEKVKILFIISFSISFLFFMKNQKSSMNFSSNMIYNINWNLLFITMMTILLIMMFMSKLIYMPMKPSKSLK